MFLPRNKAGPRRPKPLAGRGAHGQQVLEAVQARGRMAWPNRSLRLRRAHRAAPRINAPWPKTRPTARHCAVTVPMGLVLVYSATIASMRSPFRDARHGGEMPPAPIPRTMFCPPHAALGAGMRRPGVVDIRSGGAHRNWRAGWISPLHVRHYLGPEEK